MKEFKHFELRATRKPMQDARLASAVTVVDPDGNPGYAHVAFSQTFVSAVGQMLPRGVSLQDPAHLHVFFDHLRGLWSVNARYLNDRSAATELWTSKEKPTWLNIHRMPKGKQHGNRPA